MSHVRVGDLVPSDEDLARRRRLEQVDAAQQGGLARAGRPDDADDLARVDVQVDVLEHLELPEGLVQVPDRDDGRAGGGRRSSVGHRAFA